MDELELVSCLSKFSTLKSRIAAMEILKETIKTHVISFLCILSSKGLKSKIFEISNNYTYIDSITLNEETNEIIIHLTTNHGISSSYEKETYPIDLVSNLDGKAIEKYVESLKK